MRFKKIFQSIIRGDLHNLIIFFNIIFFAYAFIVLFFNDITFTSRLFIDNYDFQEFWYKFGSWLKDFTLPYDGPYGYDYPILSVYICGLPFLFSSEIVFYNIFMKILLISITYIDILLLFRFIKEIYKINSDIKTTRLNILLLFMMPMILYLCFCRFESISLLFMIFSFDKMKNHRYGWSMVFLSLGYWIKQVVIMLLPLFITWMYQKRRNDLKGQSNTMNTSPQTTTDLETQTTYRNTILLLIRRIYKEVVIRVKIVIIPFLAFVITSIILILPNILGNQLDSIFFNYVFQLNRGSNHEGYGALFEYLFGIEEPAPFFIFGIPITYLPLLIIQFSIFFIGFFIKIESFDDLLKSSGFVFIWFIIFSKFQSPQWLLWFIFYIFLSRLSQYHLIQILIPTFFWGLFNYLIFISPIGSIMWCIFLIGKYISQYYFFYIMLKHTKFQNIFKNEKGFFTPS